jgi:Asp-tRNA(Asn)/Glu-tRNA(Gln) amidotransferase A subunit family amidase
MEQERPHVLLGKPNYNSGFDKVQPQWGSVVKIAVRIIGVTALLMTSRVSAQNFAIEEATIAGVQQALQTKAATCRQIVQAYLDRIAAYDHSGPALNSILALNPKVLAEADRLDAERANGAAVGPLYCAPLVLKDNHNTADLPTTGGSASLAGMQPPADAFVVARLRKAGAIILGKTNMHEFALSGTTVSSLGGQTLDPYDLTRTPGGSSGGTGAAVAANLAIAGTGSDTVNSIRSPASANALVGIRPTKGLLSRAGIMPVSETQDAIGPITRTVADGARLLEVMAGYDRNDPATAWSVGNTPTGYLQFLKANGLRGARIGVLKTMFGNGPEHQEVNGVMAAAIAALKSAGAEVVEIDVPALDAGKLNADNDVQKYEFKTSINAYLSTIPNAPVKSLAEIIASGKFHKPSLEKFLTSAEGFANGMEEPDYKERLLRNQRARQVLISVFAEHRLDAVVYPLQKRLVVPLTELNQADRNGILASVTGFPAITVPAGFSPPTATAPLGVPVGMDILGRPWSEGRLIELAYGFEQAVHARKPPKSAPALAGH